MFAGLLVHPESRSKEEISPVGCEPSAYQPYMVHSEHV